MKVRLEHKKTGEVIEYENVLGVDPFGADSDGPVFQLILQNRETATFHKKEWTCFTLKWEMVL